jgi:hypothetical protein
MASRHAVLQKPCCCYSDESVLSCTAMELPCINNGFVTRKQLHYADSLVLPMYIKVMPEAIAMSYRITVIVLQKLCVGFR